MYRLCIHFQIRLTSGQALTQSFQAKEPLSAVRVYVQMNGSEVPDNFTFMTTFPRKVFTPEDFDKPLSALGTLQFVSYCKNLKSWNTKKELL